MKNIDHIGIAVKDLEASKKLFSNLMGVMPFHEETIESQGLKVAFIQLGETKIELIASEKEHTSISRFIEKKGEGQHHIAFMVEDIEKEMSRMKQKGFRPLSDKPYKGALNKLVCFFHPKTTNGVLVELCQKIKND